MIEAERTTEWQGNVKGDWQSKHYAVVADLMLTALTSFLSFSRSFSSSASL